MLSPDDETFAKFVFYAAHGVEELWVVDPLARSVRIWQLDPAAAEYRETGTSDLLDLTATSVADQLDWPEGQPRRAHGPQPLRPNGSPAQVLLRRLPDARPVRKPVTWAWAVSVAVAVFASALFAAPRAGVERWHVIAAALPARGALAVGFATALVVVVVLLALRTWRPRVGLPLACALAMATALHLPVVLSRGVVGEPVAAPAAGQLRVLEWNTNTDLTTPDVVAQLAAEQRADVVVLPEVALHSGSAYRRAFAAAGDPLMRVNRHTSSTQVAVWMAPQLARHYASAAGPDPVKTVELRPDTASLPTVLALHAPWPVGARLAGWDRDVDWVASQCSTGRPVLVAGDFNASTDDFGGPRLGRCLDAATQRNSAGVGTWSTHLPTMVAMPIDHVLATPSAGTVTSFTVLTSEDGSGTRHRPTMTVLTVADRP